MNALTSRARALSAAQWRDLLLPWALALVTGIEYFDNAIFSFFASYIAGGINASPDELVWSSSAYAVAAVLGILQQQWWTNRLGHRDYVVGCMLLYALGAVLAAFCNTSLELAFARGFQGYFIGPMMGACRILIQTEFAPKPRAGAAKLFLSLILVSSALAPIAGGMLVAHLDWRALFACTAPLAVMFAGLAWFALPDTGNILPEERGSSHLWPYLLFAGALGALQIVLQQVRFQLFSASPLLMLMTALGLGAIAWFVYHQWHHPKPLMRLQALRVRAFRVGLVLYIFYYFQSTGFSYLISRFLEQGIGFPIENTGWLVGITSLISAGSLFFYYRYSKLAPHKKWIIVPAFATTAAISWWMAGLSPQVGEAELILPMLLRGPFMLFVILPVAGLTFQTLAVEEFSHGYRLKNIARQLTISFATAIIIIVEQHRQNLHQAQLSDFVDAANPAFQATLHTLEAAYAAAGQTASAAHALSMSAISRMVAQQANILASLDGFYVLMAVAICATVFACWQRQID